MEIFNVTAMYAAAKDVVRWLYRERISASDLLAARTKWAPTFQSRVYKQRQERLRQDAVVVNVKKLRDYDVGRDTKRGISNFFKIGLVRAYDKEIAALLQITHVRQLDDGWVTAHYREEDAIKAYLVGFIGYENIVDVHWDGDDSTGLPVIYCRFREKNGTPYNRVSFCTCSDEYEDLLPRYEEFADARSVFRNELMNL